MSKSARVFNWRLDTQGGFLILEINIFMVTYSYQANSKQEQILYNLIAKQDTYVFDNYFRAIVNHRLCFYLSTYYANIAEYSVSNIISACVSIVSNYNFLQCKKKISIVAQNVVTLIDISESFSVIVDFKLGTKDTLFYHL